MKKIALLLSAFFVLAFANMGKAQSYDSAIGLRFGAPLAASYKFFVTESNAIELYLGYRSYGIGYTFLNPGAMFQVHKPINGVDGLSWYFGAGASLFLYNFKDNYCAGCDGLAFGVNGVLGLDYRFADAPINLSVDWLPTIVIAGDFSGFGGGNGALSARYILGE